MINSETTAPHRLAGTLTRFALPSIASVWVFSLYGIVDGIFVGQGVGPKALAAVNLSLPFVGLLFAVSIVVTIGAATAAGIQRGRGDLTGACRSFSMAVYSLAGFGLVACALSYFYLEQIAWLLGARGDMIGRVTEYLSVLLMFNTAYLISYALEVFCKVDGFPGRELLAICLAALTNILLDYLFIIEWQMGLTGAALATGIAQSTSFLFLLLHFSGLLGGQSRLKLKPVLPDPIKLSGFIRTGLPDGITELSMGLILLAFNNAIARYFGVQELAAFSVLGYISIMMLQTFLGLTQGMQPLVSYLNGRKQYQPLLHCLQLTLIAALTIGILAYGLILGAGEQIAGFFLNTEHLIGLSYQLMLPFTAAFMVMGLNVVLAGFFTALDHPLYAGGIAILRGGSLVAVLLIFVPPLYSPDAIWLIPLISELIVALTGFGLLYHFRRNRISPQEDLAPGSV